MSAEEQLVFPPFRFGTANDCLIRDYKKIPLRPKTLAVLRYLVENPHRLVPKQELLDAVWKNTRVSDAAAKVSIREIRKALGDIAAEPKFIETVGTSGYRFIAPVSMQIPSAAGGVESAPFVGRDAELEQLQRHFKSANGGKRQFVFVSGEPGIGTTTLVEAFLKTLLVSHGVLSAVGLCIEQYGAGEAYLPILDLLERMCNLPIRETILDSLRQYAPSWLASLPTLISPEERAELARQAAGTTPELRVREITAFLEAVSKTRTLVLVLEDLHWVDPSTLGLISFIARRPEPARLMIIGTYREDAVERSNHPLKTVKGELQLHHHCAHLSLKFLSQRAVSEYLAARFDTPQISANLLSTVYRRCEGNPLFMVNVTDYLLRREAIVRENGSVKLLETSEREPVPETIRDLIKRQFDALPREDQILLETASVGGTTFSVAAIARVLDRPREITEARYRELMGRTHFLQYAGLRIRPNGRGTPRYSFVHALYQNVIYDRIDAARRRRLHQKIGERTEAVYVGVTELVAAELAHHFEHAGAHHRAVRYLLQAGQIARAKSGYQEAINYARKGLNLLKWLPDIPDRKELELALEIVLGSSIASTKGYLAEETNASFSRARLLSQETGSDSVLFRALTALWSYYLLSARLRLALEQGQHMLNLAERAQDPFFFLNGHMAVGMALFHQGDVVAADDHLGKSFSYYHLGARHRELHALGWDPGVRGSCYRAKSTWLLGYPEQDLKIAGTALALARELASPFHLAHASASLANHFASRGKIEEALQLANEAVILSSENGFAHWLALGTIVKGWALCRRGEITEGLGYFHEGLKNWQARGAQSVVPAILLRQAECYESAGQIDKALASVEEGLAVSDRIEDRLYYADLYRLKGELLLKDKKSGQVEGFSEVEKCILKAIDVSRHQKAKSYELRSVISLYRLRQKQGKAKLAHAILKKIYGWFTEGFASPDLREAKRLLDE